MRAILAAGAAVDSGDAAIERHQVSFNREFGIFGLNGPGQLAEHCGVNRQFHIGVGGVFGAKGNLVGAAIAVIDDDDAMDLVKVDRNLKMLPEGGLPSAIK